MLADVCLSLVDNNINMNYIVDINRMIVGCSDLFIYLTLALFHEISILNCTTFTYVYIHFTHTFTNAQMKWFKKVFCAQQTQFHFPS